MKKRLIVLFLLTAMAAALLAACGGDDSAPITEQTAISIALEDAGLVKADVENLHTHVVTWQDIPSYSIHFLHRELEYEYVIDARSGDILYTDTLE